MNNIVNTHKLYDLTTFKIGGGAKYFTVCGSIEELHKCVTWCNNRGIPWFVLGGGSNILVSDDGFPGLVIKLGGRFKKVKFDEKANGKIIDDLSVEAAEFIAVKSYKAKGKRLSKNTVKSVSFLDPLPYDPPSEEADLRENDVAQDDLPAKEQMKKSVEVQKDDGKEHPKTDKIEDPEDSSQTKLNL